MSAAPKPTHQCPVDECEEQIPLSRLMDWNHWRMVPKPLQDDVLAAWNNGRGRGSLEHLNAAQAAIDYVNQKLVSKKAAVSRNRMENA